MSDFINTIDLYGDEVTATAIIERAITEFNDDVLATMKRDAFSYCYKLTTINLPNVTHVGDYVFTDGKALTSVNVPRATHLGMGAFQGCAALKELNLPSVDTLGSNCFSGCSQLNTLILGSTTVCTLGSIYVFTNTPFAAGKAGGTVYVPQALIESYQTATNWSTLYAAGTCNFVAIEGSEYE